MEKKISGSIGRQETASAPPRTTGRTAKTAPETPILLLEGIGKDRALMLDERSTALFTDVPEETLREWRASKKKTGPRFVRSKGRILYPLPGVLEYLGERLKGVDIEARPVLHDEPRHAADDGADCAGR